MQKLNNFEIAKLITITIEIQSKTSTDSNGTTLVTFFMKITFKISQTIKFVIIYETHNIFFGQQIIAIVLVIIKAYKELNKVENSMLNKIINEYKIPDINNKTKSVTNIFLFNFKIKQTSKIIIGIKIKTLIKIPLVKFISGTKKPINIVINKTNKPFL